MLRLKLEAFGGDPIDHVCEEMCQVATRLDIITSVKFNDVSLNAFPNSNPIDLVDGYYKEVKNPPNLPKVVFSHPSNPSPSATVFPT